MNLFEFIGYRYVRLISNSKINITKQPQDSSVLEKIKKKTDLICFLLFLNRILQHEVTYKNLLHL